jgi:hypothetical protein
MFKKGSDIMSLWSKLQQTPRQEVAQEWKGTLAEYIDTIVPNRPHSTDTAAQRMWATQQIQERNSFAQEIKHFFTHRNSVRRKIRRSHLDETEAAVLWVS